jgi:hypothetical protein
VTSPDKALSTHEGNGRAAIADFEIARGGPFYELQQQLVRLDAHAAKAPVRAAVLVGVAWGVPLILSTLEGNAVGPPSSRPFLLGLDVWARFVIAIGIFVLMERLVEDRLRICFRQFVRAPLIAPRSMPAAAAAVTRSLRRRDSNAAELVCLAVAALISTFTIAIQFQAETSSWLVVAGPDGARLTVAGWWCGLISNTLLWFLLFRWLWRHLLWGMLLREIAGLELRLVATHPDGNGGLGFVAAYPSAFAAFIFAISCVVGAALAKELMEGDLPAANFGYVMAAWLVVVAALFVYPLVAFSRPLAALKESTLLVSSAGATRRYRAAERETLGRNIAAADETATEAAANVPDPAKIYAAAKGLSTILFSRSALMPVGAAALLPLAAAAATELPLKEILQIAKRLLLL